MDKNKVYCLRDIEEILLQSLAVALSGSSTSTYKKIDGISTEALPFFNESSFINVTTKEIVTDIEKIRLPGEKWIIDGLNELVAKIKPLKEQPNVVYVSLHPRKYKNIDEKTHYVYAIRLYYI